MAEENPVNVGLSPQELAIMFSGPGTYKDELWPLISQAVLKVSVNPKLRARINEVFKDITLQENNDDNDDVRKAEFKAALKALQDKVKEIKIRNDTKGPNELEKLRENQAIFPAMAKGGKRRRKSKKRNYYKKRRMTKQR
jgi:hypothetical protein